MKRLRLMGFCLATAACVPAAAAAYAVGRMNLFTPVVHQKDFATGTETVGIYCPAIFVTEQDCLVRASRFCVFAPTESRLATQTQAVRLFELNSFVPNNENFLQTHSFECVAPGKDTQ